MEKNRFTKTAVFPEMKRKQLVVDHNDDDHCMWHFIVEFISGKKVDDVTRMPPVARQEFSQLRALFDKCNCKLVMSSGAMMRLAAGTWFPLELDFFYFSNQSGQKNQPVNELCTWFARNQWTKEPVAGNDSSSEEKSYLCGKRERWLAPFSSKRSVLIHTKALVKDQQDLFCTFDVWPDKNNREEGGVEKKVYKKTVVEVDGQKKDSSNNRDHLLQMVSSDLKFDSRSIQWYENAESGELQPVHHIDAMMLQSRHLYAMEEVPDKKRNRFFLDEAPHCFQDFYTYCQDKDDLVERCATFNEQELEELVLKYGSTYLAELVARHCERQKLHIEWPFVWDKELFARRCTDRKCGAIVWFDPHAWHVHEKHRMIVVHGWSTLKQEENHRMALKYQQKIVVADLFGFISPDIAKLLFEYMPCTQLAMIVWPELSTNRLTGMWKNALTIDWLVDRIFRQWMSEVNLFFDSELYLPVRCSFYDGKQSFCNLDTDCSDEEGCLCQVPTIPKECTAFWVFVIQQLAFGERLLVRAGEATWTSVMQQVNDASLKCILPLKDLSCHDTCNTIDVQVVLAGVQQPLFV